MYRKVIIKKFTAFALLAIFTLSTMPTKYLHQLFANHTDFITVTNDNFKIPQLNVSGIDCHCNSLVVIVPYTCSSETVTQKIPLSFAGYSIANGSNICFYPVFFSELRGPPSFA
ncbi:MAG: hypothetical protein M3Z26_04820 [Bacteroidota bacterium]|nr:hypothetical protein [Bacteroidota bacterium]